MNPNGAAAAAPRSSGEHARIVPWAAAAGAQRPARLDTSRTFDEFWPGRQVTVLAECRGGQGTTAIPGWVCASVPVLLARRWPGARTQQILSRVLDIGDLLVPDLAASLTVPSVVVWICPVDWWRAAAATGATGVPGCIPWPIAQLLT